jgi:hypothetical protein
MPPLTRFTVPLNPEPDDNIYDRRDAAAEDEAKIKRDDEVLQQLTMPKPSTVTNETLLSLLGPNKNNP